MKAEAPDQDLLDALNAVALEEVELRKVIDDISLAYERGACTIMTFWLTQKKLTKAAPHKADAILTRLQALSAIIDSDEMKRWTLSDGTGVMPSARRALVAAAAKHPLSIVNGDIAFEKESFLRRILELARPEGSHS